MGHTAIILLIAIYLKVDGDCAVFLHVPVLRVQHAQAGAEAVPSAGFESTEYHQRHERTR